MGKIKSVSSKEILKIGTKVRYQGDIGQSIGTVVQLGGSNNSERIKELLQLQSIDGVVRIEWSPGNDEFWYPISWLEIVD